MTITVRCVFQRNARGNPFGYNGSWRPDKETKTPEDMAQRLARLNGYQEGDTFATFDIYYSGETLGNF